MPIFETVTLTWKGRAYEIPPDRVMRCIAKVEDVVTLVALGRYFQNRDLPLAKVAQAYGIILREAGALVTDEEIYTVLFDVGDMQRQALDAVRTLQMLMIPPEHLREKTKPDALEGKATAAGAQLLQ